MLGPATLRDALIWVQTDREASVQLRYHPEEKPGEARLSAPVKATRDADLALTFELSELVPGTTYRYEVYVDGALVESPAPLRFKTDALWQFRSPPPDVAFLIGSCAYVNDPAFDRPGEPYGSAFEILESMAKQKADTMVWLGDNLYTREVDFFSPGGLRYRYRHHRAFGPLQPLLSAMRHYAIWDDHDFGPNDSSGEYQLKGESLRLFKRYWPAFHYGLPDTPGVFQTFRIADAQLFLTDGRYYRKPGGWPDGPEKSLLGREQLAWLEAALLSSNAAFKIIAVGSPVLNPNVTRDESYGLYATELRELLDFIKARKIEGVLFLSGDRHRTELWRRVGPGMYPLHDYTSSPLTSGPYPVKPGSPESKGIDRVPGTLVEEHNFGVVRLEGKGKERKLVLEARDKTGALRFTHEIRRDELRFPEAAPAVSK